jgi:hypothetical protein
MIVQVEGLADFLENGLVQKQLPDVEEFDQRLLFVVCMGALEGDVEDLGHTGLEVADIVALDVFEYAVQHVHEGKPVSTLVLKEGGY